MSPWRTCAACDTDLYPRLARRTDEGWVCGGRSAQPCATRVATAERMAARAEDVAWMAATGESAIGAAARLGITTGALEQFCKRYGLREEWTRLVDHNPRDHNNAVGFEVSRRRAA